MTGGIEEALALAKKAAGSKDIKIGGGVATVRQYLEAGLIDSLYIVWYPFFLVRDSRCSMVSSLHAWGFA